VHFIAADLAKEDLVSALARSSFRHEIPTFFSWLGVTVYLTRDANLSTLRAIAACAAPGSELVFTYVDQIEFAPERLRSRHNQNAQTVAAVGEPYVSGFDPDEIAGDVRRVGFELVEDLDGKDMWERYARASATLGQPPASLHIVLARMDRAAR
jgi:methyltransferase (TIGR00027 family)